jgi:hypothetical protein
LPYDGASPPKLVQLCQGCATYYEAATPCNSLTFSINDFIFSLPNINRERLLHPENLRYHLYRDRGC